jgi:hypothetical protein
MTTFATTLTFALCSACVALLTLTPAANGAEQRIQCPLELPAGAFRLAQVPAGWVGHVPYKFLLHSAQFMSGPPSDMAISMGEEVVLDKHRKQTRYAGLNAGIQYKGGKWMACFYGGGNDAILSRKLADDTDECVVTYTSYIRDRREGTDIEIRCK